MKYVVVCLPKTDGTIGSGILMKEIGQRDNFVTLERTFEAMEPQPDGSMVLACVLSIQEDGSIGWRKRGTDGPFELAESAGNFYLYAPGIRHHGDLKLPVYPIVRFPEGITL